ncbi:hypothetical protein DSO57_1033532 [Entomophthora muscae]|uniref:Uncharacterized protein n=1 Tax=Entomophthora muscae TaxID=34485 RepID=A0ACC2TMG7_9FUNG|nr:hypothetical protein DSO57_1033532 [Entomophthora muscae]
MLFQSAALLFTLAQAAPASSVVITPYVSPSTAYGSNYEYANTGTSNYNIHQTPQKNTYVVNAAGTNYVATANQTANSQPSGINDNTDQADSNSVSKVKQGAISVTQT